MPDERTPDEFKTEPEFAAFFAWQRGSGAGAARAAAKGASDFEGALFAAFVAGWHARDRHAD